MACPTLKGAKIRFHATPVCIGIACAFLLGTAWLAPAQAPKLQVLIITGQNGHDWRATTPVLRKLLEDTQRFEVRVTEEFRGAGPDTLAPYDLVVLNYYDSNKPALRWGERADTALLDFVRGGKGLVVYHFSAAAFNGWTEYEKTLRRKLAAQQRPSLRAPRFHRDRLRPRTPDHARHARHLPAGQRRIVCEPEVAARRLVSRARHRL